MEKPISVLIQEMKNDTLSAITKHNLHPSIARMVVGELYQEICTVADKQYLREREAYEHAEASEERTEET